MPTSGLMQPADESPFRSNHVDQATFSVGTETSNAITVGLTLKDQKYKAVGRKAAVMVYLSDGSGGDDLAASAPSGGVAAGTDGLLIPLVAGKSFLAVTEDTGEIDLILTEVTTKTFYLNVVLPSGKVVTQAVAFA